MHIYTGQGQRTVQLIVTEGLGMKSWEMVLPFYVTEFCGTNQIAAICDVYIPTLWPSANCISSIPIAKPHPKCDRKVHDVFPSQR